MAKYPPGNADSFARWLEQQSAEEFYQREEDEHYDRAFTEEGPQEEGRDSYHERFPGKKPNGSYANGHSQPEEKAYVGPESIDFATSLHIPIKQREWLDKHKLLRKNTGFQLNGDGGVGKTEVSLQMMVGMCATGLMFNMPVERGTCLFVSFEEPENEIRWRVDHLAYAFNIPSANVKNLHILDLTRERDPWMFKEKDRQLVTTDRWTWLQKEIEKIKPLFVVMDNKTRFFGGNQNDAMLSTSYAHHIELACRDFDTTIMPLAHVSLSQLSSGRGDSGSVAAGNAFRSRLFFGHPDKDREPDEADTGDRRLSVMKANATPTGTNFDFKWDIGLEYFRCLYEPPKADDGIGRADKAENVFIYLTGLYNHQGLDLSPSPSSPNYAPKLFSDHPKRDKVTFKQFNLAFKILMAEGRIMAIPVGQASKGKKQLVVSTAPP